MKGTLSQAQAYDLDDLPDEGALRDLFEEAGLGEDVVKFDQAILLEGIDGVLEEGAVSLGELEMLWGDDSKPLDYAGFKEWYNEVLKLYDNFLMKDAIAPPAELMDEDEGDVPQRTYTDDELLEDAPAQGQSIKDLVDPLEKAPQQAVAASGESRTNVEVTQLFRECCDENNLLSFEGLQEVSEISQLLRDDEMTLDELQGMWDELPKTDTSIDVLRFRDLLKKIDDLFEFVDDEEDEAAVVKAAPRRDPALVKQELIAQVEDLLDIEVKACGLDGNEETDTGILKLCGELEQWWRDTVDDLDTFDLTPMCGDWELYYNTSAKFRRWGSVLNTGRDIKENALEALVQSFRMDADAFMNEYDMEELLLSEGQERAMRALGSWRVVVQSNVVSGEDDLVLKLQLNDVEYDAEDGEVKKADQKTFASQMCRTFCYMYICYMDDDLRIMRTGLTLKQVYIFRRMPEEDEDDEDAAS